MAFDLNSDAWVQKSAASVYGSPGIEGIRGIEAVACNR